MSHPAVKTETPSQKLTLPQPPMLCILQKLHVTAQAAEPEEDGNPSGKIARVLLPSLHRGLNPLNTRNRRCSSSARAWAMLQMQPSLPQHSCKGSCAMHWKQLVEWHIPRAHIAVRLLDLCATMNFEKHVTTKDQSYTCMHSHQHTPLFIVHMSTSPYSTKEAKGSTQQIRT